MLAIAIMSSPKKSLPQGRTTVRDIAQATGVHYSTVSMALRNSPRLRAETRKKIQKAAKALGYVPDPMLSALNAYRRANTTPKFQAVIAWINNWPERDKLRDVFGSYYEGARKRAHQAGYLLEEFWMHSPGMTPERLYRILKARNIQALLIAPQPHPHMNPQINFADYSAVAFGYSMEPSVLHVVTNHHFYSVILALTHLSQLGYRRIGLYIGEEWDDKSGNACLGATLFFQHKHPEVTCYFSKGESFTTLGKWLAKIKPDVVVSFDSLEHGIRELGYSIPRDIGFASLDRRPENKHLSGIDQNGFMIGQKAVDVLIGMIHRGERGVPAVPFRTLLESTWAPGTTLRPQNCPAKSHRVPRQRSPNKTKRNARNRAKVQRVE